MNTVSLAMLNGWEIVLILAVILVLFGARRLPELARGLGQGIKEFKKATRDVTDELNRAIDEEPTYTPPAERKLPEKTVAQTPETAPSAEAAPQSSSELKD